MAWEEEKNRAIANLQGVINGATRILNLPANGIVNASIAAKLDELRDKAKKLHAKLEKNEFEIAVVGLEKSGKSTFSNALSGLDILPTADARCTYTSTCIRAGNANSAKIYFHTEADLTRDLQNKLDLLDIPNPGAYSFDSLTPAKYEDLYNQCTPEKKLLYQDTVNEDIKEMLANKDSLRRYLGRGERGYSEEEISQSDFRGFITEPGKAMAVREIVIYSTHLAAMPNAVLYDVPGFDSPTAMHKEQTLEKMGSADAIIAVASAKSPSLTSPALDVFRKSDIDGCRLSDKLFVFANKADQVADAASLRENLLTTQHEWIEKRNILPHGLSHRILTGSAYAAGGNAAAKAKLEELGVDDGIEIIRAKLAEYNREERFDVLKKRIARILAEVDELFKDARKNFAPGSPSTYLKDITLEVVNLLDRLRPELSAGLDAIKDEMNQGLRETRPISADIRSRIDELITEDKYTPRQEEIDQIHRAHVGVGSAEMPDTLDTRLRDSRFNQMYGDFCDAVQGSTAERHKGNAARVENLFMNAMHVQPGQTGYDDLAANVRALCGLDEPGDDLYYHSLLERFGRDLFEVLIKYRQGNERLKKFCEEMPSFLSMGVYYDSETPSATPVDSIFWRILLYPELAEMPDFSDILNLLKTKSGLKTIGPALQQSLRQAINQNGPKIVEIIETGLQNCPKGANEAILVAFVKKILDEAISASGTDLNRLLKEEYLDDVHKRRGNYNYQTVAEEFNADIRALHRVLTGAFVPAVNMDKAFSARESRHIEAIRNRLASQEFRDFITENAPLIEAARIGELREAEGRRKADEAVMSEISEILSKIGTAV